MAETPLTEEQTTALRAWIEESATVRSLQHEAKQTERLAQLRSLAEQHAEAKAALTQHESVRDEHAKAARAAEARADDLRARVTKTETKLNDGTGLTSRDLLSLQDEIAGLQTRIEDVELEQMQELESAEAAQAQTEAAHTHADEIAAAGRALQQERGSEAERLTGELAAHEQTRTDLLERIPASLHARLRTESDYPSAAVVTAGACGACGAQLSGVIADSYRNLDVGGLLDCDSCGTLLLKIA